VIDHGGNNGGNVIKYLEIMKDEEVICWACRRGKFSSLYSELHV
jgi:hypothetical protein